MQTRLKRCLLFGSIEQILQKYHRFQRSGNFYKFLCLCFGLGSTPMVFINLKKPKRYASSREGSQRGYNGRGHSNFSVTASGLCYKSEKSVLTPSQRNIIFSFNSRFNHINIATDPREISKITSIRLGNVQSVSISHVYRFYSSQN